MTSQTQSHIYTVSKLNKFAKHILESEIGQIWISAEISNFIAASSGHWYFTLKDPRAQIKSAMFKGNNRFSRVMPKNGDKVLVRGSVSLYEPRGDFQLIATHMEPEGEGLLKQQFEQIKQKLAAEGLFAQEDKQAIPENPIRIGVITSDTGAAWHDIVTVLKRRNPTTEVILYPSLVQGEMAAENLCRALHVANQRNEVDVIILGRGGGSMEDLWCFNDEMLARTIYQSPIPVISAVGHEVDFTIADFVADMRAPTPSAAAEIAAPPLQNSIELLTQLKQRLLKAWQNQLRAKEHGYALLQHKLQGCHPKNQLLQQQQRVDHLQMTLAALWRDTLLKKTMQSEQQLSRLSNVHPKHQLSGLQQRLQYLQEKLTKSQKQMLVNKRQKLANVCQLLDTVSPLATLARGYTLTYKNGELVKKAKEVKSGDELVTRFADGEVSSIVN